MGQYYVVKDGAVKVPGSTQNHLSSMVYYYCGDLQVESPVNPRSKIKREHRWMMHDFFDFAAEQGISRDDLYTTTWEVLLPNGVKLGHWHDA